MRVRDVDTSMLDNASLMCDTVLVTRQIGAMHIATTRRQHKDKVYETVLLRHSYREDGKVKNETLANLSYLPPETIELIRESLAGKTHVLAGENFDTERALPHGHVAATFAMAHKLGLAKLLGPSCPEADLALSLVIARAVRPSSKLATTRWWKDTTLGVDLVPADTSTDEVYAAMDWLLARQSTIEASLARRHFSEGAMVLYDLSSSWMRGRTAHLPPGATRGPQVRKGPDRIRPFDRPGGAPGLSRGVPWQHRGPDRLHLGARGGAHPLFPARGSHGGRPGHDHLGPHRGA